MKLKQNNFLFNIKKGSFIVITIFLTLGFSVSLHSLLASWVNPTANPPINNQEIPIYSVSSVNQTIDLSGGTGGGLSVNGKFGVVDESYLLGKVGIATTNPGIYTLNVNGTIFANTYYGGSCDVAERYDAVPEERDELGPGDILILDKDRKLNVKKSNKAYDNMVIGVFSTDPMITMGNFEGSNDKDNPPVALLGRVPTKVTTENGPVEIGDLIVSSSKPGYGMKCDDYSKCQGAIVGKALENLERGERLIEVLINVGM